MSQGDPRSYVQNSPLVYELTIDVDDDVPETDISETDVQAVQGNSGLAAIRSLHFVLELKL